MKDFKINIPEKITDAMQILGFLFILYIIITIFSSGVCVIFLNIAFISSILPISIGLGVVFLIFALGVIFE